jgi:tungstate transport system substrate-binding protein
MPIRRLAPALLVLVLAVLTACQAPTATATPAATARPADPPKPTAAAPASAPGAATTPSATPAAAAKPTPVARDPGGKEIILATTTSTQDSGLLDVLVPTFEKQSGLRVKTISVGTGAALALGARGEADVVLVHAPDAEKEWMAQGNGTERILVMHNDFVVVGPPDDPAGVKGEKSALAALQKIAEKQATWVSRDDSSGTDQLEKKLWKDAGLTPRGQGWYLVSGQGMGATLTLADQKSGYTITDRATYLARKGTLQATLLVEGDPVLLNIYHVMPVNPSKFPGVRVNAEGGQAFARFLIAPETQQLIAGFGKDKYGQPLFSPDAGKKEEDVGKAA